MRTESRAVLQTIEAGNWAVCKHCEGNVKFSAKVKLPRVICNVYVDGRWDRVEIYHAQCYDEAGRPHGEPVDARRRYGK